MLRWILVAGWVAVAAVRVDAQGSVPIPATEQLVMKSNTNQVEYRIDVALPAGYATSSKRYPVFYVLDANLSFGSLVDIYRGARIEGDVPEMILVGVGYLEDDASVFTPFYDASRSRDYTPTNVESAIPGSGHAREFLTFLTSELAPMVERRYRADSTDRGLGGHSLGGLFTTYALLTEPTAFRRYWIGSPSLWWDKQSLFDSVAPAKGRKDQPRGRAYLSVGALELDVMVPPMVRMAGLLKSSFPGLTVGSIVYPAETHMSVVAGALSRAIRFLYARPTVALTVADAAGYAGRWVSPAGETLTISARANKLFYQMQMYGISALIELSSETRDLLFGKGIGFDLVAERDGRGRVVKLHRSMLGAETVFERAKGGSDAPRKPSR